MNRRKRKKLYSECINSVYSGKTFSEKRTETLCKKIRNVIRMINSKPFYKLDRRDLLFSCKRLEDFDCCNYGRYFFYEIRNPYFDTDDWDGEYICIGNTLDVDEIREGLRELNQRRSMREELRWKNYTE